MIKQTKTKNKNKKQNKTNKQKSKEIIGERWANKQETNKQQKLQVQDQQNFSLSLSSSVTPPVSSPGVGISAEVLS
jgi:hypothetical protein